MLAVGRVLAEHAGERQTGEDVVGERRRGRRRLLEGSELAPGVGCERLAVGDGRLKKEEVGRQGDGEQEDILDDGDEGRVEDPPGEPAKDALGPVVAEDEPAVVFRPRVEEAAAPAVEGEPGRPGELGGEGEELDRG